MICSVSTFEPAGPAAVMVAGFFASMKLEEVQTPAFLFIA